ncbi:MULTISPECIES: DUF1896 family protein [Bacteroidales]|uniref:DUF1896 family protein n=1 Tax=Bacteroidales TaxID=171549 RepID=UPI0035A08288
MKYSSHSEPAEMSYFRLNLLAYLRDAHPDKANDLAFISGRGDMAAEAYSQAIKEGLDHIQAAEIANETLFKGLHFSPYNMLVEILRNEFADEVPPGEAETKAIGLFPLCRALFAQYNLNDDFADTTEYQWLYTELVGAIQLLLEDELQ